MSLFSLMATLGLDSSGYEQGLDDAERKGQTFGQKIKTGLATAAKIGATALTAVTGAATAFGISAIKTGQDFDVGMSQVAATLGITMADIKDNVNGAGDTFDALREKAMQMGAETNFTATQAAEGLNILAMSGFDAQSSMDMLGDVLHLAAAGSMDMASAAGYISGTLKGFNDATKDSGYYADLMAKGATLANTSVSQLGDAMSAGAAGAAAYSQDAESMTLSLLRLAEQGEVGAAAGTALAAAMKDIFTPTDQAKKALQELGVAAYDTNGNARDFNDVINDLDSALAGYSEEQKNSYKQTIFGIQGLNAYNKMTVTGVSKQKQWADALAAASDGAGEAAKQYETMTDNLQGDLDILGSAFDGLKLAVSDTLTGSAREFVQFGSTALSTITEGFKKGGIDGAMKAVGDMLSKGISLIFSKLPEVVKVGTSLLNALVTGIVDNLPKMTDAAIEIVLTLADTIALNLPILLQKFGDAALKMAEKLSDPDTLSHFLTAVLALFNWIAQGIADNLPTLISSVETVLQNIIQFIGENMSRFFTVGLNILTTLGQAVMDNLPLMIEAFTGLLNSVIGYITENLPMFLDMGMQFINFLIQGITDNLPLIIETVTDLIGTIIAFLAENLPQFLDSGIKMIESLAQGVTDNLPTIIDAVLNILNTLIGFIMDHLPEFLQKGLELIVSLANGVMQNLPIIINAISQILTALVNFILDNLPMIIQMGIRLVSELAKGLIENLPAIIQATVQLITALLQGILEHLPEIIQAGIELIGSLIVGLIKAIPEIIKALPQIFKAIINGFKEVNWGEIGRNIIDGIKQGIIDFAGNLWQAAKDAVNGVIGSVKNFLGIHSPSRVFRDQIGVMIGRGLAEGIENSAVEAVNAAEMMAGDVVSEMDALQGLNSDFSGRLAVEPIESSPDMMEGNRSVVINVYGAEGQNVAELAEIISQKLAFGYKQEQMAWA